MNQITTYNLKFKPYGMHDKPYILVKHTGIKFAVGEHEWYPTSEVVRVEDEQGYTHDAFPDELEPINTDSNDA
ncbi:hypothetical protein MA9V2_097 [Chryseobacterium phage MA9V-2]|nr:hypothetical protein MA9V2_097 [Chryseobacterium phage MA9V-2]